jgi:hypothetical protein
VLVLPFAASAGFERRTAADNARRWYTGLGAPRVDVVLDDGPDLAPVLATAAAGPTLVVLPGGSPQRLLEALAPHTAVLQSAVANGVAVSGASAGAMVLCGWTVLPGRRLRVVRALSIVDVDLVVPHYREGTSWVEAAAGALPEDAVVLGLPERSGAVLTPRGELVAVGVEPFRRLPVRAGR